MSDDRDKTLEVAFGRMEEQLRNVVHDIRELKTVMVGFMPSREILARHEAIDERHDALVKTVDEIKGNLAKAAWAIFSSWVGGLVVAVKAFK